jgi:hypothetical protein
MKTSISPSLHKDRSQSLEIDGGKSVSNKSQMRNQSYPEMEGKRVSTYTEIHQKSKSKSKNPGRIYQSLDAHRLSVGDCDKTPKSKKDPSPSGAMEDAGSNRQHLTVLNTSAFLNNSAFLNDSCSMLGLAKKHVESNRLSATQGLG